MAYLFTIIKFTIIKKPQITIIKPTKKDFSFHLLPIISYSYMKWSNNRDHDIVIAWLFWMIDIEF